MPIHFAHLSIGSGELARQQVVEDDDGLIQVPHVHPIHFALGVGGRVAATGAVGARPVWGGEEVFFK